MRMTMRTLVASLWAVFLLPAVAAGQDLDGILHPIDRLVRDVGPDPSVVRKDQEPAARLVAEWRRVGSFPETLRIGALDGSIEETFGEITDVAVREDGAILVLDARANAVRVFAPNGDFLETVGRPGRGPGEFMSPVAFAVDDANRRLLVADITHSLTVFERVDGGYEYVTRTTLSAAPHDVCSGDGSTVISMLPSDPSDPIQLMDDEWTVQNRIPASYLSDSPAIRRAANEGLLACDESDTILFSPLLLGLVRAFNPSDGSVRWTAEFENYRPTELWQLENGGMASRTTQRGTDRFLSIVPFADAVLVQVAGQTVQGHERQLPYVSIDTYLIDRRTGNGGYIGSGLGQVGAIGEDYWIEVQQLPFPQLIVYRRPS